MERAGPMHTARFARPAAMLSRSASETAATVSIPRLWQARIMRTAISPRLATKTRVTGMNAPESAKPTRIFPNSDKKLVPCRDERDLWFDDEQRLPEFDELAVLRN